MTMLRMIRFQTGVLSFAIALGGASGCATTRELLGPSQSWNLQASHEEPAASGKITVKDSGDGNRTVEISVEHLAPPARAFDGTTTYIVWITPDQGGPPQNMGVLALNSDLSGSFKTQTPYRTFSVLVTAESAANVTQPGPHRALTGDVRLPS